MPSFRPAGPADLDAVLPLVQALHLKVEHDKPAAGAWYRRLGFQDHNRRLLTRRLEEATDRQPPAPGRR